MNKEIKTEAMMKIIRNFNDESLMNEIIDIAMGLSESMAIDCESKEDRKLALDLIKKHICGVVNEIVEYDIWNEDIVGGINE